MVFPVGAEGGVTFEASVSGMVGWSSEEFWAGAKHVVLVTLMESEKKVRTSNSQLSGWTDQNKTKQKKESASIFVPGESPTRSLPFWLTS